MVAGIDLYLSCVSCLSLFSLGHSLPQSSFALWQPCVGATITLEHTFSTAVFLLYSKFGPGSSPASLRILRQGTSALWNALPCGMPCPVAEPP